MTNAIGSGDGLMTTTTQSPVTKRLVAHFIVEGEPVSKERARVTSRGTFTPQKTRDAEELVASQFTRQNAAYALQTAKSPTTMYELRCHFYNGNRRRRDIDNMAKLIQDALNKWAFVDDSQIFELTAVKSFVPKADARTEVWLYVLEVTGGAA